MADIEEPFIFSDEHQRLVTTKMADPAFTHVAWGSEELLDLRRAVRDYYRSAQTGYCAYCKNDVSLQSVMNCHVEHIAPKSRYRHFMFESKNLCVICADCNEIKREQETLNQIPDTVVGGSTRQRYPRSSNSFKIVHPHFDVYEEHIDRFGHFYVDLTDKGHFTIGACKLNRKLREFGRDAAFDLTEVVDAASLLLNGKDSNTQIQALFALKRLLAPL